MTAGTLDIQQLVNESGVPRRTIYFYVQQGLLPPPQGAGLAAYYTHAHLVRLRLIPILRRQGLRLDSIRERFSRLSVEEIETMLQDAERSQLGNPVPKDRFPHRLAETRVRPEPILPGSQLLGEEQYIHYRLPAGITLVVPVNLAPDERRRLEQLLQAAGRIFSVNGPQYVYHASEEK